MPIAVGVVLRNMGKASTAELLRHCAITAEDAGVHSIWVTDHIAIPLDDAEGSDGRYVDPLATLAWLGGQTRRIGLGTGVLVLPYRPKLPAAKWIASVQELTGNRLILGVGIGWMEAEFRAVGIDISHRVSNSEDTLRFLHECFTQQTVMVNGQEILFRPRPQRPPFLIGGRAPHAISRALKLGDGWIPLDNNTERLAPLISDYRARAAVLGKEAKVYAFGSLGGNGSDPADHLARLEAIGVDVAITPAAYRDAHTFDACIERLAPALQHN